jgi:putative transposase
MSYCPRQIQTVLLPPVESSQYTSVVFPAELLEHGMHGSIGTVGDARDNALCESTIGLFKTEAIHDGRPPGLTVEPRMAGHMLDPLVQRGTAPLLYRAPAPIEFEHRQQQATTVASTPEVA